MNFYLVTTKLSLLSLAVIASASLFIASFSTPTLAANVDTSQSQANSQGAAESFVNYICDTTSYPVAMGAWPSAPSFNEGNGELTYTANLVWRTCDGGDLTRAFAITGYPGGNGELATCPHAGNYHNGYDNTYDCIKYTDSDAGHFGGYANLSCPWGSDEACVMPIFWPVVERYAKQPGTGFQYAHISMPNSYVRDWSVATQTTGSYTFERSPAFCTYWKWNSNGISGYGNCIGMKIIASWVRYNFTLTPTITVSPQTGSVGAPVAPIPAVNNSGPTSSFDNTKWQLTRFRVVPGRDIPHPSGGASTINPMSYYRVDTTNGNAVGSNLINLKSGTKAFVKGTTNASNYSEFNINGEIIPDEPVGTKICYALSVQPRKHDDNQWQHSAPRCVIVSKSPKVQVLGGDLIVGRKTAHNVAPTGGSKVVTSVSYAHNAGRHYGSWSEYAIIPSGTVTGMASGAMYVGGSPTSDLCRLSVLTVANTLNAGCQQTAIGSYPSSSPAPDIASRFPATQSINTSSVDISTLTPIQQVYSVRGPTLNITSSQPFGYDAGSGKGKWIVINDRDATVTIRSNINYAKTETLHQINDIPQVVIIAKNIIIDESVTNVDAWLIAVGTGNNGYINTCGSVAAGHPTSSTLNAKRCAGPDPVSKPAPLTINGPILANKLYLYRTAGSGTGARVADPAEIFNLRADAYIWASGYSPGIGRVPTVTTKEVPPRF